MMFALEHFYLDGLSTAFDLRLFWTGNESNKLYPLLFKLIDFELEAFAINYIIYFRKMLFWTLTKTG